MTADRKEETAEQRNDGTTKTEGQYHGPIRKKGVRGPYTKPRYIDLYSRQWKLI